MSGGIPNPLPSPSKAEALNDEPPVKGGHPPVKKQIKNLTKKDGKLPGHYGADLAARVGVLEAAVLALGIEEFGDVAGHDFHGNQWTAIGDRVREHLASLGPRPGKTPEETKALDKAYADKVVEHAKTNNITNWEDAKNSFEDAPHIAAQNAAFDRVRAAAEDRAPKKGDIAVLKDGGFIKVGSAAKGYIVGNGFSQKGGPAYYEDAKHSDAVGYIKATANQDTKNLDRWIRSNYDLSVGDINWDAGKK